MPMHADTQREARPIAVSFGESGKLVGLSRRTMYDLFNRGEINTFTVGSRRLVLVSELERWATERQGATESGDHAPAA
jgi:excisionase family DNA binding protein